jgi:hypothetical protein
MSLQELSDSYLPLIDAILATPDTENDDDDLDPTSDD